MILKSYGKYGHSAISEVSFESKSTIYGKYNANILLSNTLAKYVNHANVLENSIT